MAQEKTKENYERECRTGTMNRTAEVGGKLCSLELGLDPATLVLPDELGPEMPQRDPTAAGVDSFRPAFVKTRGEEAEIEKDAGVPVARRICFPLERGKSQEVKAY